MKAMPIDPTST